MNIILIGASNNIEKFGNKILKDLVKKGHNVIPINPNEKKIEGLKTHKMLSTAPKSCEIINFVVPPKVTLQILKKYKNLLINKKVWIQPWAEDEEIKTYLVENNFNDTIIGKCIMLEEKL